MSLVSKRFARKRAINVNFSIFTRYRDTSQKFDDMKMRLEVLHHIKFGQQVLPLWFRSVNCKMTTQELLPFKAITLNVTKARVDTNWARKFHLDREATEGASHVSIALPCLLWSSNWDHVFFTTHSRIDSALNLVHYLRGAEIKFPLLL